MGVIHEKGRPRCALEYAGESGAPDARVKLREALRAVDSTLSKCEKAQVKLREGMPPSLLAQHIHFLVVLYTEAAINI
jgi:hypothetical protein